MQFFIDPFYSTLYVKDVNFPVKFLLHQVFSLCGLNRIEINKFLSNVYFLNNFYLPFASTFLISGALGCGERH